MNKLFHWAVLSAVILLAACSSSSRGSDGPSATVERFYDGIRSGDYREAALCFYYEGESSDRDIETMTEMLRDYMAPELKKLGDFRVETVSERIDDDGRQATVEILLSHGDAPAETESLKLRKTSDGWKMLPYL